MKLKLYQILTGLNKIEVKTSRDLSTIIILGTMSDDGQMLPKIYRERKFMLKKNCMKYQNKTGIGNFKRNANAILYSGNKIPFLWCEVPKVGSTSWVKLFINAW